MNFNRDKFFDGYKETFGPLDQGQVDGLNQLLDGYEEYFGWWDNIDQISNSLSQIKHETAHSFQPVVEGYYLGNPNAPGYFQGNTERVLRFHRSLRYYPHIGRGHIQLTWLENHEEQDGLIRRYFPEVISQFEARTGKTFDLIKHPEQALDPQISFCVMTIGMHKGTFREGHTLDRYINSKSIDHFGARNIVNGDRFYKNKQGVRIGDVIARDALKFKKILSAALVKENFADLTDAETDLSTSTAVPADEPAEIPDLVAGQRQSDTPKLPPNPTDEPPSALTGSGGGATSTEFTSTQTQQTPEGEKTISASISTPIGDPPEAKPSFWMSVEDWKPAIKRWFSRGLKGTTGFNFAQLTGNAGLMAKFPEYWYIFAGAAVVLVLGSGTCLAIGGAVGLLIWIVNRREISAAKLLEAEHRNDPTKKNLGVIVERK
jgi:hypothetical protein